MYINKIKTTKASFFHPTSTSHAFSGSHDLIYQEQLLGQSGSSIEPLFFTTVIVINLLFHW
jgi:hypothetical protein